MLCNNPKKEISSRKSGEGGKRRKKKNETLLDPSLQIPSGPLRLAQNYWQNVLLFWEEKRKLKEGKGGLRLTQKHL